MEVGVDRAGAHRAGVGYLLLAQTYPVLDADVVNRERAARAQLTIGYLPHYRRSHLVSSVAVLKF